MFGEERRIRIVRRRARANDGGDMLTDMECEKLLLVKCSVHPKY